MPNNQVVLVTGASTGFGRLFTETLARKGYTVFATMRDPKGKNAKNSAAEIEALAKKESLPIHILELDVTKDDSVDKALKAVIDKAGRIDVVINNAGFPVVGLTETITVEQAQSQFDTNFFGCVRVNRAALPYMRKQKSGLLLHISSGAGRLVFPTFGFYCASKFALEAFSEAYNYELAGQGIQSISSPARRVSDGDLRQHPSGRGQSRERRRMEPRIKFCQRSTKGLAKNAGNAQEVADAVLRIIETPAVQAQGSLSRQPARHRRRCHQRSLRETQDALFQAFGLAEDVKFVTAGRRVELTRVR